MRLISAALLIALQTSSCGFFGPNDDSGSSHENTPVSKKTFELTGEEFSELTGDQVRTLVNKIDGLKTFSGLDLVSKRLDASMIARSKSANFSKCAKSKLDNTPLQVTNDAVTFEFDFDLTAICDTAASPDDLIAELRNTYKGYFTVSCPGGTFDKLRGKSVKDLSDNLCVGAQTQRMSYNFTVNARKATKVKNGAEYEVNFVESTLINISMASANGSPCMINATDEKTRSFDTCRFVRQEKAFTGKPQFESKSPNEKIDPHPTVFQMAATISSATVDTTAPYYQAATTTFNVNGWNGEVKYNNAWTAPSWTAKFQNGGEVGGELN